MFRAEFRECLKRSLTQYIPVICYECGERSVEYVGHIETVNNRKLHMLYVRCFSDALVVPPDLYITIEDDHVFYELFKDCDNVWAISWMFADDIQTRVAAEHQEQTTHIKL